MPFSSGKVKGARGLVLGRSIGWRGAGETLRRREVTWATSGAARPLSDVCLRCMSLRRLVGGGL